MMVAPARFRHEESAMPRQRSTVSISPERGVDAWMELPPGKPVAGVLLAHCLPADNPALALISSSFADRGCAVLTIDCVASGETQAGLNPPELTAAARDFAGRHGPLLLIGHSWGGVLGLACAADLPQVQALVTVGTPAGSRGFARRATVAANRVAIGAQTMELPDAERQQNGDPHSGCKDDRPGTRLAGHGACCPSRAPVFHCWHSRTPFTGRSSSMGRMMSRGTAIRA